MTQAANAEGVAKLARQLQAESLRLGFGEERLPRAPAAESLTGLYDALVTARALVSATRKLFLDGHYADAVEKAYKCVNNTVRAKSGLSLDGQDLMNQAFSEKSPALRLSDLKSDSKRNEQAGYMLIFAGCMRGIRNPRAHEHDLRDDPLAALEMLIWANHLMRVVERSARSRKRKRS